MRAKTLRSVVTFQTTTAAMAMETACAAAGLPGRLIPVPTQITAGCGMAWSAPAEAEAALKAFIAEKGLAASGFYLMML